MKKQKLVVVVGPTASGKTKLAIEIAKEFNGEIISADSRQVYRGLDIGTAKVTAEDMQGVPHHLLDIVDIDTIYTANDYKRDASLCINDITARGHVPIVAGGTFFYIDTLLERIAPPKVEPNPELRAVLETKTNETLFAELVTKDPRRAQSIDKNNKRRLIRALEIIAELGEVPPLDPPNPPYNTLLIGIVTDPADLRTRLEKRAHNWQQNGLIEEVEFLLERGVSRDRLREIGFEYMVVVDYLDGHIPQEKFVEVLVQKNWQYAKRQFTWLKRDPTINWVTPSDKREVSLLVQSFLMSN